MPMFVQVEAKEAESDRYNLRMFAASDQEADEWMKAIEEGKRPKTIQRPFFSRTSYIACQRRKRGTDSESKAGAFFSRSTRGSSVSGLDLFRVI